MYVSIIQIRKVRHGEVMTLFFVALYEVVCAVKDFCVEQVLVV